MMVAERQSTNHAPRQRVAIELLALDLSRCGRCTRTDANLEEALRSVADVLREADVQVEVQKTVVRTAEQAEGLRFESSPTIRVNGRDIALELQESPCNECGELCGCQGGVNCCVWVWHGKEYLEAPKPMIVEAVLRAYCQAEERQSAPPKLYRLPDNLRRLFDTMAMPAPKEQAKDECCDPNPSAGTCGRKT